MMTWAWLGEMSFMGRVRGQRGYILVVVMLLLSLFTIMIIAMLDTSVMERLISRNSRDAEQAFQLAEGAVYLGIEQSYQVLSRDYRTVEILPTSILLEQSSFADNINGQAVQMQVSNPRLIEQCSDYSLYEFTGTGLCPPAKNRLKVQVRFEYLQYYTPQYGEDGSIVNMVFTHRDYLDRGQVVLMKKEMGN